jgi:L-ribulose-5-phosphate 3-epimerase
MNRRTLIKNALGISLIGNSLRSEGSYWNSKDKKLRISACDWSLGKAGSLEAFDVARDIGLDGVQVSMGTLKDNLQLRDRSLQKAYLQKSKETGVQISSLAIGELNNVPYKSDPITIEWVSASIDAAANLGVSVILLAFFERGDLRNDAEGKAEVVRRLKAIAPKAERLGITLGIESYLSAPELTEMIHATGSKNIKVYYDFRNSADAGYDVIQELDFLGRDAICELHMKENGFLLGNGTLDWPRIAEKLKSINYYGDGWMQIEWAKPASVDIVEAYQYNLNYLKNLFH